MNIYITNDSKLADRERKKNWTVKIFQLDCKINL